MKTQTESSFWTRLLVSICVICLVTQVTFAQANNITVQVDKPGAPVPKTLFGLFFEDINFGADGGLSGEGGAGDAGIEPDTQGDGASGRP